MLTISQSSPLARFRPGYRPNGAKLALKPVHVWRSRWPRNGRRVRESSWNMSRTEAAAVL